MKQCANEHRHQLEAYLFDTGVGYEVLDAIVQANVDLNRITADELEFMVSQCLRKPKRRPPRDFGSWAESTSQHQNSRFVSA